MRVYNSRDLRESERFPGAFRDPDGAFLLLIHRPSFLDSGLYVEVTEVQLRDCILSARQTADVHRSLGAGEIAEFSACRDPLGRNGLRVVRRVG